MFNRVNAREKEYGTRFTVNIGFTYEGLKTLGLSQRSLDSFPAAFRAACEAVPVKSVMSARPRRNIWEGGLGGPDIHAMAWIRTDSAMRVIRAEMALTGGVDIRFVQDTMALAHENGIGSSGNPYDNRKHTGPVPCLDVGWLVRFSDKTRNSPARPIQETLYIRTIRDFATSLEEVLLMALFVPSLRMANTAYSLFGRSDGTSGLDGHVI